MGPLLLLVMVCGTDAWAQSPIPRRQIPPTVLAELGLLENRFELALAKDCNAERCFSKGCTYVDHAVIDRPRTRSLPGLGQEPGPGAVEPQEFLTRARCGFAHEEGLEAGDVQVLSARLQTKLSTAWMVVQVERQALKPLPPGLRQAPEAEPAPDPEPEPDLPVAAAVPSWSAASAARELWTALLPHLFWMIGLVLFTVAGTALIWAWRRVGRDTLEDQLLMAQLTREAGAPAPADPADAPDTEEAFVATQAAAWGERLDAVDPDHPDPEIQALVRELLREGDMPLLAKAVLRFGNFADAFPAGGDIAAAKLELSDYLKGVDTEALPSDADFFRALNRHASSAAVAAQADVQVVRSLREEFGASGLAALIGTLPPRPGALLFALAPATQQHELVRLLPQRQAAGMAAMLLSSDRMSPRETAHLFAVLEAVRGDRSLPPVPAADEVADRGVALDAAGALSVLLQGVEPARRSALFARALERFGGALPSWYRGILVPEMLLRLPGEARADLLLGVDVEALAAWLSLVDDAGRARVLEGAPGSLRRSVEASSVFPSWVRQVALAARGRRELAAGLQRQLARLRIPFADVVVDDTGAP